MNSKISNLTLNKQLNHRIFYNKLPQYNRIKRNIFYQDYEPLIKTSHYIGESIILFTILYSTLNWIHYRNIRKEIEKNNKK